MYEGHVAIIACIRAWKLCNSGQSAHRVPIQSYFGSARYLSKKRQNVFFSLFLEVRDVRPFLIFYFRSSPSTHSQTQHQHTHTHARTQRNLRHTDTRTHTLTSTHTDILHIQIYCCTYNTNRAQLNWRFFKKQKHNIPAQTTAPPWHHTRNSPASLTSGLSRFLSWTTRSNLWVRSVCTVRAQNELRYKTHTFIESNDCNQMMLPRCASVCNSWE